MALWLAANPGASSTGVPTPGAAVFSTGGGAVGTGATEDVVAGATADAGDEPAGDVDGTGGVGVAPGAAPEFGDGGAAAPDDEGSGAVGVDCANAALSSERAPNTAKMEAILTTLVDTSDEPFSKRTFAFVRSGARVVGPRELE